MHKIVISTIKGVQDKLDNQKGSIELFGYDIMVDEDFNPWLLEINSSPAMDFSTVSFFNDRLWLKSYHAKSKEPQSIFW